MSKCTAANCRNEGWAAQPTKDSAFCHKHWGGANRITVTSRYGGRDHFRKVKVYFLKADGYIKVGSSMDPISRLRTIRSGTDSSWAPEDLDRSSIECIGYVFGSRMFERELHGRFAEHRVNGEWFHATPDIESHLHELMAA